MTVIIGLIRIKDQENEPEGGERYATCFDMRSEVTAKYAQDYRSDLNFFNAWDFN